MQHIPILIYVMQYVCRVHRYYISIANQQQHTAAAEVLALMWA